MPGRARVYTVSATAKATAAPPSWVMDRCTAALFSAAQAAAAPLSS